MFVVPSDPETSPPACLNPAAHGVWYPLVVPRGGAACPTHSISAIPTLYETGADVATLETPDPQ